MGNWGRRPAKRKSDFMHAEENLPRGPGCYGEKHVLSTGDAGS